MKLPNLIPAEATVRQEEETKTETVSLSKLSRVWYDKGYATTHIKTNNTASPRLQEDTNCVG